ncbi:MAG: hypothetical protein QHH07_08125 [Sedimentisphaerales bacterium]|nr:hypothetical protein [Sedimentisphaerales bacterium]
MGQDEAQIKDLYVPFACICTGLVLMAVDSLLLTRGAYKDLLHAILIGLVVRAVSYTIVMLLGLSLCSWFGYAFEPYLTSLLQLTGVALLACTLGDTLGTVIGCAGPYVNIILCLGLIGYFFAHDVINAVIAIFLLLAGHSVVNFVLLPMAKTFFK